MATKVRKQVYIERYQEALLKRLAAEIGVPEAEIIRRAIDEHIRLRRLPRRHLEAWEKKRAFIENLMRQGRVAGGRTWRRKDLHEP